MSVTNTVWWNWNLGWKLIVNFTAWMETQRQTKGGAITVVGQKPILDNTVDRTGLLSTLMMLTAPINNQPWKRSAVGSPPRSTLTFQDLCLTSTLLGKLPKRLGHQVKVIHRGVVCCTVWRMASAYLLHTAHYQGWWASSILFDGVSMLPLVWNCQAMHEYQAIRSLSTLLSNIGLWPPTVIALPLVCCWVSIRAVNLTINL